MVLILFLPLLPGYLFWDQDDVQDVVDDVPASHSLENAWGPYPLTTHSVWHPFWDQDDVQDMIDDVQMPLISGLMVVGNLSHILMLRLLALVLFFILLLSFSIVIIGVMLRILTIHMEVALISSRVSLALFSRFRELNIGVLFLLCKLILVFILVLII